MGRDTVGGFEQLVLLAALRLGDQANGAAILDELESRAGRSTSAGAVYVALRRLEEKGMLSSRQGESAPGRGGRPRRWYRILPQGIEVLRSARAEWAAMAEGLGDVLGTGT